MGDHVKQQIYTFANLKKEHVWMFYLRNDKLYSCQLMNQLIVEAPVYILFHFMMKKTSNQAVGLEPHLCTAADTEVCLSQL